jgi:hypothetical protein
MYWDVVEVKPVAPLTLAVRFSDGLTGQVRFLESALRRVFVILKEPDFSREFSWGMAGCPSCQRGIAGHAACAL